MSKRVWLITGAGRGMGIDIVKAALAAGHAVLAMDRDPKRVTSAFGAPRRPAPCQTRCHQPWRCPGRGFGRDRPLRPDRCSGQQRGQLLRGILRRDQPRGLPGADRDDPLRPGDATRAVLPIMRPQRSGLVIAISSTAGIVGQEFCSAYSASKFGVEGWIESLTPEVAPFGIRTMLVEPGFFRTDLLTPESTNYAASSIDDYANAPTDRHRLERNERETGRRPGEARRRAGSSSPAKTSRRSAWSLAPTRSTRSSRRPETSSPRPTPIETSHRHSPTTTDLFVAAVLGRTTLQRPLASRRPQQGIERATGRVEGGKTA